MSASQLTDEQFKAITQQLAPLEPPLTPDWQPLLYTTATLIALVAIAVAIYYLRKHQQSKNTLSICNEAKSELLKLKSRWQNRELNDSDTAYHLCTILRIGLQLKQLTQTPPPHLITHKQPWQHTITLLSELRYANRSSHSLSEEIFTLAEQWLVEDRSSTEATC